MVGPASAPTRISRPEVFESYYLETLEGWYFAVKGLEHPPDRRIAVLRYAPDSENGDRTKEGIRYRRLYGFSEQEAWIQQLCPQYLAYEPVFQTILQSVPLKSIRRIYDPNLLYQTLIGRPNLDPVLKDAVAFLLILQKEAAVPASSFGITGSLLIGLHMERSDIDVVCLGNDSCVKVHRALRRLLNDTDCNDICRLDANGLKELHAQRFTDTKIPYKDFVELERQKVNQARFRARTYFIRFIKMPHETVETFGSHLYTQLGRQEVKATIADDRDAIFTPCRYVLSDVQKTGNPSLPAPDTIVSFRGRFCEQARVGERIAAAGILEKVHDRDGRIHHRLLLGNSPEDTMVQIR